MINRELQVYVPLYRLLKGLEGDRGFKNVERKWVQWDKVDAEDQPWCCMNDRPEEKGEQNTRGTPARWSIPLDIWIYLRVPENKSRSEVMNPLLDIVTNLFDWAPPDGVQNLGGMVNWVKLDGAIVKSGGIFEEQAIALIPISVILPGSPASGVTS